MNKLVFSLLAFVLAVTAAYANPGVEMKASPLFKMSLENSIAKLEGAAEPAEEMLATEGSDCPSPNRPETEQSSCSPTVCGGSYTCNGSTCSSSPTCWSTCSGNTCSGNTCSNTCAGGTCSYNYIWRGLNKWNYNGQSGSNWYGFLSIHPNWFFVDGDKTEILFRGSNRPPNETDPYWYPQSGYFDINKWYANAITNIYDVKGWVKLKLFFDDGWTRFYSVLHSLSPPDNSGIYHIVDFYF